MNRQRFLWLLAAAALAISAALYLSTQRNLPRDAHGSALLPSLAHEMDTVTALSVRRAAKLPTVTVHQQNGQWTVAERGDYPADVSKLRKLLLELSDAKIIEEKTSNPASYPIIGVEDPALPGATGAEIVIAAKDGKHALIIGKPVGEGNFARRGGETSSYIVEPGISFEAEPRYWIDPHLLDIAAGTIQSIEVKPVAGPGYTVHRAAAAPPTTPTASAATTKAVNAGAGTTATNGGTAAAAGTGAGHTADAAASADANAGSADAGAGARAGAVNFVLDGVPAGRKAADPTLLAPSPTTYSGLTADDVTTVGDIDFSRATVATVTLTDGNVITLTGATSGDKHWVHVQATKDAALNMKAAGRAFEITGYRYDAIFRPLEQLLVPKELPAAKKGASTAAAGGSAKPPSSKKPPPAPPQ